MNFKYALFWFLFLVFLTCIEGCTTTNKNLRLLVSKDQIKEEVFTVNDGDTVVCDPRGCHILK